MEILHVYESTYDSVTELSHMNRETPTRRQFVRSAGVASTIIIAGCLGDKNDSDRVGGNLALVNSSGEAVGVTVRITDRESEERILRDLYQVPPSDDGIFVEDVVTTTGSYDVEATAKDTDRAVSEVWNLPSSKYYHLQVAILSDGSLKISGDGI